MFAIYELLEENGNQIKLMRSQTKIEIYKFGNHVKQMLSDRFVKLKQLKGN